MSKKDRIIDTLFYYGYFSEYLPIEFSTVDFKKLKNASIKSTVIKPYFYTMNKNDTSLERRTISIPDIGSYVNSVKYLSSSSIIDKFILLTDSNEHSLSKIFTRDGKVRAFANPYLAPLPLSKKLKDSDDFISNTIIKLRKSNGSKGLLKLDIANFYGSFYTHNITCIGHDSVWAEERYQEDQNGNTNQEYKVLKGLDNHIGLLNQKRTHGLLIGPLLSYIIAESLMATIDNELDLELKNTIGKKINYVRFMDDYDIFIKKETSIPLVIASFTKVLERYGFVLSDSKTEYKPFPYYVYEDFSEVIDTEKEEKSSRDLLTIYSKLSNYEIHKAQKGGLFFLSSNIHHLTNQSNFKESISILLSTIKMNAKSIPASCRSIVNIYQIFKDKIDVNILFDDIYEYLNECVDKNYVWETSWLIYTLIKINMGVFIDRLSDIFRMKLDDLPLIIIVNELPLIEMNPDIIKSFSTKHSWLLNYELYRLEIITDDELRTKTEDGNLFDNFQLMKSKKVKLYHKYEKKVDQEPPLK